MCQWQVGWEDEDAEARARLLSRQGVAMVMADPIRVVDEQGRDVPRDGETIGEIVMSGNNVMKGYFDDPEATAEAFRGGVFHSGDLGVRHPDGYVELRDRAKDVVVSGGENISTIEVEQAIVSHPAVLEAAVIGIPDDRWGERPKAFVVVRPARRRPSRRTSAPTFASAWPATSAPTRSSCSTSCRARPPARCASTSCASASGRAGSRAIN